MKKLIILFSCILAVTLAMFTPWVGSILAKEDVAFATNSQPNDKNGVKLGQFSSRSAYLVDYDTGTVLYERNAESKHPIASMVKIMTLNIVFDEIQKGNLAFDEKIVISEVASGMG
ncbi:MAG: serine hydrolase, partial [Clostridia bacterium]|nr:serine hydrolase [Clostridia bacterium]